MSTAPRPLPRITLDDAPFWEAARRHELLLQHCLDCGAYYEPPIEDCWACHSEQPRIEWAKASGRGTVFTFNVYHRAYHPWFADKLPYNTAIVELEEGPLLRTQIVGCANEAIRIGMPVEATYEDVDERISLPKFRPVSTETP